MPSYNQDYLLAISFYDLVWGRKGNQSMITSLNVSLQNLDMSAVLPTLAGPAVTRVTTGPVAGASYPRNTDMLLQMMSSSKIVIQQSFF